jgi:hypothetical protein
MTSKTIATCPECGGSLGFADVAIIGENMLVNGYESVAECPRCGVQWEWASSGEIQRKDDGDGGGEDYTTFGGRRPKIKKECACGCRETFFTSHADKHYLNDAHAMRGYRKGIVVEPKKRNVGTRAPTRKEKR